MKTATAGLMTGMLGIGALLVHPAIAMMTLLGTGLASTPETPVPDLAQTLWGISLWGTLAAVVAFFALMIFWTKPLAVIYALVWTTLVGCYVTGCLIADSYLLPFLGLDGTLPLASAGFALFSVWQHRSKVGAD